MFDTPIQHYLVQTIGQHGYVTLTPSEVAQWLDQEAKQLLALGAFWEAMPIDTHLKDLGQYRRRRHSSFIYRQGKLAQTHHRAHWQSLNYNALHGGLQRWFEPIEPALVASAAWQATLLAFGALAAELTPAAQSCIEAHQFRIDTANGIGRPTPEGAHRDGVDLVAVFLIHRQHIKGGETSVFDNQTNTGIRFTLAQPWSLVLLDDTAVTHETSPIQPLSPELAHLGHRDTLVLTSRADSFQAPMAPQLKANP
jgi:hypothetical protein